MRSAEEVALYAILLREAARNRHIGPESLLDDFACNEEHHISFAAMLAHQHFTELDWELVQLLADHPREVPEIAGALYEQEQMLEAEALCHARPPNGFKSGAKWAQPIRQRWAQIRASMRAYENESITVSLHTVHQVAKDAFMRARPQLTDDDYWTLFQQDPELPLYDFQEWRGAYKRAGLAVSTDDG